MTEVQVVDAVTVLSTGQWA